MATESRAQEHHAPLLEDSDDDQDIELAHLGGNVDPYPLSAAKPTKGVSNIMIAASLIVTIVGFVVNTEAAAYYEDVLGWRKPFASLYIMHSSLSLPWLCHLAYLRYKHRDKPYQRWVRDYNNELRTSISSVEAFALHGPSMVWKRAGSMGGPLDYLATTMAIVTLVLTVSGISWFLSLALTTPSDLTAIYNCSTFFAAAFSVPLLRQKLGWVSIGAVALSIIGTIIIAYGDTKGSSDAKSEEPPQVGASRLLGNLVALIGAVAFGLYEVLFKKWACSSRPTNPQSSLHLTFAASALTGIYTFSTFWIVLILLHIFHIEPFVIPGLKVIGYIIASVLAGAGKSVWMAIHKKPASDMSDHSIYYFSPSPRHLDEPGIWLCSICVSRSNKCHL